MWLLVALGAALALGLNRQFTEGQARVLALLIGLLLVAYAALRFSLL